ncbi:hypothetical protein J437_LFUL002848 [Ladona fulva]|uniref:AN1-type domain-containing protein n=1 Tax=Ladona fulva TaxID=123851 RepID=A0A8K0K1Y0_LADFU|nr:hypothetical protein J437_LFUL002848 [Ladona fulva]
MAELPNLGKHCSKDDCTRLDFLPLICSHCEKIFCKEHHSVTEHCCIQFQEKDVIVKRKNAASVTKCSVVGCEDAVGTVHHSCTFCGAPVCLKHRHNDPHTHNCNSAPKKVPLPSEIHKENFSKAFDAVEKEINSKLEAASHGKRKATADRIKLMRLKSRAVCPPGTSVPLESRAYFTASHKLDNSPNSIPVYLSKMWSLGRTVDLIEKLFKLSGKSNQKGSLLVERNTSNICSDMTKTIGSLLEDNVLLEGDTLVLQHDN